MCCFFFLFFSFSVFFNFLALSPSMQDLSSPTRDRAAPPAVEAHSLNHWTAREVPVLVIFSLPIPTLFCPTLYLGRLTA